MIPRHDPIKTSLDKIEKQLDSQKIGLVAVKNIRSQLIRLQTQETSHIYRDRIDSLLKSAQSIQVSLIEAQLPLYDYEKKNKKGNNKSSLKNFEDKKNIYNPADSVKNSTNPFVSLDEDKKTQLPGGNKKSQNQNQKQNKNRINNNPFNVGESSTGTIQNNLPFAPPRAPLTNPFASVSKEGKISSPTVHWSKDSSKLGKAKELLGEEYTYYNLPDVTSFLINKKIDVEHADFSHILQAVGNSTGFWTKVGWLLGRFLSGLFFRSPTSDKKNDIECAHIVGLMALQAEIDSKVKALEKPPSEEKAKTARPKITKITNPGTPSPTEENPIHIRKQKEQKNKDFTVYLAWDKAYKDNPTLIQVSNSIPHEEEKLDISAQEDIYLIYQRTRIVKNEVNELLTQSRNIQSNFHRGINNTITTLIQDSATRFEGVLLVQAEIMQKLEAFLNIIGEPDLKANNPTQRVSFQEVNEVSKFLIETLPSDVLGSKKKEIQDKAQALIEKTKILMESEEFEGRKNLTQLKNILQEFEQKTDEKPDNILSKLQAIREKLSTVLSNTRATDPRIISDFVAEVAAVLRQTVSLQEQYQTITAESKKLQLIINNNQSFSEKAAAIKKIKTNLEKISPSNENKLAANVISLKKDVQNLENCYRNIGKFQDCSKITLDKFTTIKDMAAKISGEFQSQQLKEAIESLSSKINVSSSPSEPLPILITPMPDPPIKNEINDKERGNLAKKQQESQNKSVNKEIIKAISYHFENNFNFVINKNEKLFSKDTELILDSKKEPNEVINDLKNAFQKEWPEKAEHCIYQLAAIWYILHGKCNGTEPEKNGQRRRIAEVVRDMEETRKACYTGPLTLFRNLDGHAKDFYALLTLLANNVDLQNDYLKKYSQEATLFNQRAILWRQQHSEQRRKGRAQPSYAGLSVSYTAVGNLPERPTRRKGK